MGVFIICWLPFFIYNVITGIFQANLSGYHESIFFIFTWFGYLNSGCNPIIYAFSSRDFRRAFYKILFHDNFLKNKKRKNLLFSIQSSSLSTRDSKYHLASPRLMNSVNRFKNIDNQKPSCNLCKDFELVLSKNNSLKTNWYSFKASYLEPDIAQIKNSHGKTNSSDFSRIVSSKINSNLSIQKQSQPKRSIKIFKPLILNGSKKPSYKAKHSSLRADSSNTKKKTGQIPIGTRYRFKTIKQPVQDGLDFYHQTDIGKFSLNK